MNKISAIVYLILSCIFAIGIKMLTSDNEKKTAFTLTNLKYSFVKANEDESIDEVFKRAGLNITTYHWNILRYIILLITLFILVFNFILSNVFYTNALIIIVVLFLITAPIKKLGKRKTIFILFMEMLAERFENKKDIEIYNVVIQLKNIAVSQKDKPLGSIYILENIIKFTDITKLYFNKALTFINLNKKDLAKDYLIDMLKTELGKDLSYLLMKLDDLNPYELITQLELLEERARTNNHTKRLNKTENISELIFIIPTLLFMLILLNFVIFVMNDSWNMLTF